MLSHALAGALCCACARADPRAEVVPPGEGSRVTADDQTLTPVDPSELLATSGGILRLGPAAFAIRAASTRAELGRASRATAEIDFVYRGPSAQEAPLASGELRRQIGLKLRAQDSCNVLYAMWRIQPPAGIEVSVKTNPGQSRHSECGDRGYRVVQPSWRREVDAVLPGQRHVLRAALRGTELHVDADGIVGWVGELPPSALSFDGPVGIRSDNGDFDVELRASASIDRDWSGAR